MQGPALQLLSEILVQTGGSSVMLTLCDNRVVC